jgi:hypothetical protein
VPDRDPLRQQPSERVPEQMGGLPADSVQDSDGIVGHIFSAVRRAVPAQQSGRRAGAAVTGEVRGLSGVTQVERDGMKAPVGQRGDESGRPPEAGRAQAHYQQQWLASGAAEIVECEPDIAVPGEARAG